MEIRAFYCCSSRGDDVLSSDPVSVELHYAIQLAKHTLREPRDFIGFIDSDGVTLQFMYEESGSVWVEVPMPAEKGSYGKSISLHDVTSVVAAMPEKFDKECLPGLEFQSWFA